MKKKNKAIIIFLIVLLIMEQFSFIYATTDIKIANLYSDHECERHLQYWNESMNQWRNIQTKYIVYKHNNKKYPAYCISHGLDGVDEAGSYDVTISGDILKDEKIWRVIVNGYPYKTANQLGVESNDDAYIATKQAIYTVILNRDVRKFYKGADKRGEKIVDAIEKLSNIGKNDITKPQEAIEINISKVGEFKQDTKQTEYFYQEYKVSTNVNISKYEITKISGFPDGSYICDLNNNKSTTFSGNSNFKIMVPKSKILEDINGNMSVKASCSTYPILIGKSPSSNLQNYALTGDSIEEFSGNQILNINSNKSSLKILKTDKDTNKPLKGITFNIKYEDGANIGTYTTDDNGMIEIYNLKQGKVIITEASTLEEYIFDNEKKEVILEYNKMSQINITNEHKKGNLKIYKIDLDNNEIPIENVEFEITSVDGESFKIKTDKEGTATLENLNVGKYTVREISTNEKYELNEEEKIVEIKWNETTNCIVENEKQKGQIEIEKVDEEDNTIKMSGVEFEILDEKENVVEKLVTNEEGKAISSRLPIGNYTIKEVKTDIEHILNEEIIKIQIKRNEINKLLLENKRVKGQIKIIKTSDEFNYINNQEANTPINGAEFEIYNKEGIVVDKIITNEEGIAITKMLDKGEYAVKEVKSGKWYKLNDEIYNAVINENEEIIILEIKNSPEKPGLDIEKEGPETAQKNEIIEYKFNIKNTGDTKLDNFTWIDNIPTEYVTLKQIETGTYNKEGNYNIYYKTNLQDFTILAENLSTVQNVIIDLTKLELKDTERIEQVKIEFGTVEIGFESNSIPKLYCEVNNSVKENDEFINKTVLTGNFEEYKLEDNDEVTTKIYEIKKKLPKTGY